MQCRQRFLRGLKSGQSLPTGLDVRASLWIVRLRPQIYASHMKAGIDRYANVRQRSGKPKSANAPIAPPNLPIQLPAPVYI